MPLIDSLPTPLRRLVNEAATWCMPRLDATRLATCWRSETTRPRHFESSRAATVAGLILDRRNRLGQVLTPKAGPGRFLVYFPDANLSDGAAAVETRGLFDVYNEPPWDCWIAWCSRPEASDGSYREFLVAWMPDVVVPIVQRGIDVNPEECIQWLAGLPVQYHAAFIATGSSAA